MSSSSRPKDTKTELKLKTAKNKGQKSTVFEKDTRKRIKSNVGCSKKRVFRTKNQFDFCSSDDEDEFECFNVRKASILSGNIVPNTSSSDSSSNSSGSDDDGIVLVGETNVKNGSFSRNVRDLRPDNVSEDSDEDGCEFVGQKMVKETTFSENEVIRDTDEPVNSLGVQNEPHVDSFGVSVSGDSDESTDPSIHELESSCEEDMDDSETENDVVVGRTLIRYKGFSGMEVMVKFNDSSYEKTRNFKSPKKIPQTGKVAGLKPVKECRAWKAVKSNFSKGECSKKKKHSCKEARKERKGSTVRNAELIRILLNAVNEDKKVEVNGLVHEPLRSKLRLEDEVTDPTPEQTDCDKETENEGAALKVVGESPAASCTHDLVLDDQTGGVCRFCGVERKDILPPCINERKYFGEVQNPVNDELQSHNSVNGPNESMRVQGTVWDLIPGAQKELFPHQREGFEFLWKNIAGDIAIEKLPELLSGEGRECIISHAPGTGKTRLAIVFLLSFLKHYPKARPVILAPHFILSTWENELEKWKVDISFHNMNNENLSGNETRFAGGTNKRGVRLAKLLSWIGDGGILGISYALFAILARKGEKGGEDEAIWEAIIKLPGLLVLDEGHTPRNGNGCIWNALRKLTTKRCIILSGTPFQDNFKELKILLGLVDPRLHDMGKSSWKKLTESKDELEELCSRLDPYVHYHKGSVLQRSLPGLKDTLIFLRPTEMQKELMDACKREIFLSLTYLVSLISVHPSTLMLDDEMRFVKRHAFSVFKTKLEKIESDLDEGVKIKFVMNLIQLADALGERVLIFSHFRYPLLFIKKQLETQFSWKEGKEVLYLEGKLEETYYQHSISSFNNSSSKAKVLLALQSACSEGINLAGASRVVFLTTVWNPSVERQAIGRAYRLGQKKVVYVYRLITSGMEVRQYEMNGRKDQISQMILSAVDEQAGESESSCEILEDKILEQMQNVESFRNIFEKIVHQPKESDFLKNFKFKNL